MADKPNFAALATDKDKETVGVWRTWTNGDKELEFRILRAGPSNVPFRVAYEKRTRVYRNSGVNTETLAPEIQDKITREVYSETIVTDWRGSAVEGIPFSTENLLALFEQVPDTLTFVIKEANDAASFRTKSGS